MNFNQSDLIPCEQVLPNIVLYIDHEIRLREDEVISIADWIRERAELEEARV